MPAVAVNGDHIVLVVDVDDHRRIALEVLLVEAAEAGDDHLFPDLTSRAAGPFTWTVPDPIASIA